MYLWPELWSVRVPAWACMSVRPRIMHISYVRNYSVVLENWEMALVVNALDLWRPLVAPWKCRVNFWEHVLGMCPIRHYVLLLDACGSPWGWNGRNSSCMQWLDLQKLFGSELIEVLLWRRWPVAVGLPPFSLPVLTLEVLVRKPSLNCHHSQLPFL